MELRHRGELAEFSGELHKGEIPPAKGEDAGGEFHRRFRVDYSVTVHGDPGTRRRGF